MGPFKLRVASCSGTTGADTGVGGEEVAISRDWMGGACPNARCSTSSAARMAAAAARVPSSHKISQTIKMRTFSH